MASTKYRIRATEWLTIDIRLGYSRPTMNLETLSQYIGVKDSSGKEIYEGDIVNIHDSHETCGLIYYNSQKAAFLIGRQFVVNKDKKRDDCFDYEINAYRASRKYEIIGNRWDNKELLRQDIDLNF